MLCVEKAGDKGHHLKFQKASDMFDSVDNQTLIGCLQEIVAGPRSTNIADDIRRCPRKHHCLQKFASTRVHWFHLLSVLFPCITSIPILFKVSGLNTGIEYAYTYTTQGSTPAYDTGSTIVKDTKCKERKNRVQEHRCHLYEPHFN
jgi:hypothetical protein